MAGTPDRPMTAKLPGMGFMGAGDGPGVTGPGFVPEHGPD